VLSAVALCLSVLSICLSQAGILPVWLNRIMPTSLHNSQGV